MICSWQAYINLLPGWLRGEVDRLGREQLQELRMRLGKPPELVLRNDDIWLDKSIEREDMDFVINMASRYSPWRTGSVCNGYITAAGGHRIGICGEAVLRDGSVHIINALSSLSIRVARDFPGIAQQAEGINGSVLVIGSPGMGKTTLLRDIIRQWSGNNIGAISVVDERREIFPQTNGEFCFDPGLRTDVLSGCPKSIGVEMALRTMTPSVIAVDEITAADDCEALLHAGWCGVRLLATAHASNRRELFTRPVYKPLLQSGLFQYLIILQSDKSWSLERMDL